MGEVAETLAMMCILDTLREVPLSPELLVTRLAAYDAEHGGALIDTLRAYLDHFSTCPRHPGRWVSPQHVPLSHPAGS
ncbi:hypothetical protein QF032_000934 [Streptomyces achromogenes]|uniref:Uncharacterized protein n=1 Tax=Streptomyces achromogenes TaxID=67255 RepID=A0ABU0PVF1_STRAH|nr:hypothetical protein [Streptomyces achromogenes]MDQ0681941.1 hypothetical protein [Streptomyces achromogenes]MDQ0829090.1 hypothetical protein [Streptomyces achromogenes]